MKKYSLAIVISIGVLIVGYFVNMAFNPFYKRIQWLEKEIPKYSVIATEDSLSDVISSVFAERGWTYLTLKNGSKISIRASRNGLYENNFIGDFLRTDDSVYKSAGSDTLEIKRDDAAYYFVIGKIINED